MGLFENDGGGGDNWGDDYNPWEQSYGTSQQSLWFTSVKDYRIEVDRDIVFSGEKVSGENFNRIEVERDYNILCLE
jgi:hypothetical protein